MVTIDTAFHVFVIGASPSLPCLRDRSPSVHLFLPCLFSLPPFSLQLCNTHDSCLPGTYSSHFPCLSSLLGCLPLISHEDLDGVVCSSSWALRGQNTILQTTELRHWVLASFLTLRVAVTGFVVKRLYRAAQLLQEGDR